MININDSKVYKSCRKKIYEIYVCKPPIGTCVINKLEQAHVVRQLNGKTWFSAENMQVMKVSNPQMFQFLQTNAYIVDAKKRYVLSGTQGEMWCIDEAKLCNGYISADGTGLNPQVLLRKCYYSAKGTNKKMPNQVSYIPTSKTLEAHLKEDNSNMQIDCILSVMPWHKVKTKPDSSQAFAMFIPKKEKVQVQTSWGSILQTNLPGVEHGLGDFVVCATASNGQPNLSDRWVVNGAIFAATYNNQGWGDCLDHRFTGDTTNLPRPQDLFMLDGSSASANIPDNPELYEFIGKLATYCVNTQHTELPMRVAKSKENPNEIIIDCKTILDYGDKNSTSKFNVTSVRTVIRVYKNNKVVFTNYLANDNAVKSARNFRFEIPNNRPVTDTEPIDIDEVKNYLQANVETVFGLCGYVKEVGVKNSFHNLCAFSKGDYDGVRDYTMTSGTTNRMCRGIEYDTEKSGESKAAGIRTIKNCDSFFDKVVTSRPLKVFRGQSCDDYFYKFASFDNCEGFISVNTAYTSTSLNMQSTPMFASMGKRNGQPVTEGIIYAIDLPVGVRANYIHNVAGWVQQFEILLDRCYDIQIGQTLLNFKDNKGHVFKVVQGTVVPHVPNGALNTAQSVTLYNAGKSTYDEHGRVPFEKEFNSGVLHEAFNKIRAKGFSDIQWQGAFDSRESDANGFLDQDIIINDSIVLRTNNPDTPDTNIDYAFSLMGNALVIHKIRAKTSMRQNHADAKDLRWSQYGIDCINYQRDKDGNITGADAHGLDVNLMNNFDGRQVLYLQTGSSDEIAQKIINYAKTHKNICLLPLIDVARYFDTCFTQVIEREGYELLRSIRVERHVEHSKENDSQAGFVPCKYQITGDNDDHLTIQIKFYRDKASGKLQIEYRGRSAGTKVEDGKNLTYSIFDDGIMTKLAEDIIYTFAKKMHLSKARKFDKLVDYFCYQTGCRSVRCPQTTPDSLKDYKIWSLDGKSYIALSIIRNDVEHFTVTIVRDNVFLPPFNLDTTKPIHVLYNEFCSCLVNS